MNTKTVRHKAVSQEEFRSVRVRPKPFRPDIDSHFRPASFTRAKREKTNPWFPL